MRSAAAAVALAALAVAAPAHAAALLPPSLQTDTRFAPPTGIV